MQVISKAITLQGVTPTVDDLYVSESVCWHGKAHAWAQQNKPLACVYACMCVHACACFRECVRVCVCVSIGLCRAQKSGQDRTGEQAGVCVRVCVCVCVYLRVHVCVCVHSQVLVSADGTIPRSRNCSVRRYARTLSPAHTTCHMSHVHAGCYGYPDALQVRPLFCPFDYRLAYFTPYIKHCLHSRTQCCCVTHVTSCPVHQVMTPHSIHA